jgi:outer membrane protein OmpA-like peptidoglycan-associated protein
MRTICIIVTLLVFEKSYGQTIDTSTVVWSGIMIPSGKSYPDAQVLWLRLPKEFTSSKQTGVFISRQEAYQTEFYGLHKLTVYRENNENVAEESKAFKKKLNRGTPFCRMSYRFNYNDKTGYLEGTYMAIDCRGVSGKILLYQSGQPISEDNAMTATHAWVRKLIDDLKANKLSPAKIAELRTNFEFKPLFFDFDKDLIREEYKDYLKSMALIVLSHSDLRIRVTGHTDGDGSDAYNLELSKRRAKSIVGFFMEQGLSVDRIEIDFRGKREPIAPNSTPEGKQKNRRVDFAFV